MPQTSDNNSTDDNRNRTVGLAFPLKLGNDGRLSACTYEEHIRQSLRALLLTARGRRVMRPDYGNRLGDYLFENYGETTATLIKSEISSTIRRFEPRVELLNTRVLADSANPGVISAEITYRIVATDMTDQLSLTVGKP